MSIHPVKARANAVELVSVRPGYCLARADTVVVLSLQKIGGKYG